MGVSFLDQHHFFCNTIIICTQALMMRVQLYSLHWEVACAGACLGESGTSLKLGESGRRAECRKPVLGMLLLQLLSYACA